VFRLICGGAFRVNVSNNVRELFVGLFASTPDDVLIFCIFRFCVSTCRLQGRHQQHRAATLAGSAVARIRRINMLNDSGGGAAMESIAGYAMNLNAFELDHVLDMEPDVVAEDVLRRSGIERGLPLNGGTQHVHVYIDVMSTLHRHDMVSTRHQCDYCDVDARHRTSFRSNTFYEN
jgi:hypothetical protein